MFRSLLFTLVTMYLLVCSCAIFVYDDDDDHHEDDDDSITIIIHQQPTLVGPGR